MSSDPSIAAAGPRLPQVFNGLPVSRGCVVGPVCLFHAAHHDHLPERLIEKGQEVREIDRLERAFARARVQIHALSNELKRRNGYEEMSIFDGHLMMLDDPLLGDACVERIKNELNSAETAVKHVLDGYLELFDSMDDACMRERSQDIRDVAKRVMRILAGNGEAPPVRLEQPCIVVADELSPSDTISLPSDLILGLATDRGSPTSHASLLARALGIPAVVGLETLSASVATGDTILLDGLHGRVTLNPTGAECLEAESERTRLAAEQSDNGEIDHKPAATLDGHPVTLLANADSSTSLERMLLLGAQGVGLYRTEYLWLKDGHEPSEEEQTAAYSALVRALPPGQAVTFRVFDLGGDKALKAGAQEHKEANPFLGNRSIRFLLRNPELLRRQLNAILRASALGRVQVMYPMIATIDELRAVNSELRQCMERLEAAGEPFDARLARGVMIEIPSAALIAEALARECEFFSIGTNDLIQYTLAVDRGNASVAALYQPTHHAVLRLIELTVQAAKAHGRRVSVCGESAADPVMAALYVGMGIDELSMSPNLLRCVRGLLGRITLSQARELAAMAMGMQGHTGGEIYAACRDRLLLLAPDMQCLG